MEAKAAGTIASAARGCRLARKLPPSNARLHLQLVILIVPLSQLLPTGASFPLLFKNHSKNSNDDSEFE